VSVRRAERGDVAAIVTLWRALLEAHASIDPAFAPRAGAAAGLVDAVRHALDDSDAALWVVQLDGACVGFCSARIERAPRAVREQCRVAIDEIAVAASQRRSGHGRALAEAAFAWAKERGAERVEIRVAARNATGQAFWRALGFGDFVDVLHRQL
jgi:ribosomal protein S18 acetylase RimI-like enzyme